MTNATTPTPPNMPQSWMQFAYMVNALGSEKAQNIMLRAALAAILHENGGFVEVSDAALREIEALPEDENTPILQTFTDRSHMRIHLKGHNEIEG